MPRESHPPPSSGLPGRLHGLGRRPRTIALHGDPTKGAAEAAPTAPHATAPAEKDKSGPARFWSTRRIRIALTITALFSMGLHSFLTPWKLLPDVSGFEAKDVEGDLSIPVDLLNEEPPAPPPEQTAPPEVSPVTDKPGPNARDAAAPKPKDAGPDVEPLATDAGIDLKDGGAEPATTDAGVISDASAEGGDLDGGLVALADAAAGLSGPRDPAGMVGIANAVNTGPQNVILTVNVATIAKNPLSPRIGGVLKVIPQWREFLADKNAQAIDPMQAAQWILIYGPSLIHTDRDAVLVRYTASDALVDSVVDAIAKRAAAEGKKGPKGESPGPFDAGVPGVPAALGHADNGMRVFMRPQPKLLVIVPPSHAAEAAKAFRGKAPKGPAADEAMRLVVRNPSQQIAIKGVHFDQHLKEITMVIRPDAVGGADVDAEGDCDDDAAAQTIADDLTDLLKQQNGPAIRILTHGLLNNAKVVNAGNKKVTLHLHATQDQLAAVLGLVESFTGANQPSP